MTLLGFLSTIASRRGYQTTVNAPRKATFGRGSHAVSNTAKRIRNFEHLLSPHLPVPQHLLPHPRLLLGLPKLHASIFSVDLLGLSRRSSNLALSLFDSSFLLSC